MVEAEEQCKSDGARTGVSRRRLKGESKQSVSLQRPRCESRSCARVCDESADWRLMLRAYPRLQCRSTCRRKRGLRASGDAWTAALLLLPCFLRASPACRSPIACARLPLLPVRSSCLLLFIAPCSHTRPDAPSKRSRTRLSLSLSAAAVMSGGQCKQRASASASACKRAGA